MEIVDERWLSRITRGELFVDIITNMPTVTTHVTDEWFVNAPRASFSVQVRLVPPTQFIWSRSSCRTTIATTWPTLRT